MRGLRSFALLVGLCSCTATAGAMSADGDPASDFLVTQDVFVPYPAPAPTSVARLTRAVATVYGHGYRLKVAVIATKTDLGAIPSLFGKPSAYAHFLGQELGGTFVGPLLIVMPSGFGIWDGGRPTAAESRVLATLRIGGPTAELLTTSAAAAVQKLIALGALRSKDITPPSVYPEAVTYASTQPTWLTYRVIEDSHRSRETISVYKGGRRRLLLRTPFHSAYYATPQVLTLSLGGVSDAGALRFCISSEDAAGNRAKPLCEPIRPSP